MTQSECESEVAKCPDFGHPDLEHHMCLHCGSKYECIDEEEQQTAEEMWQNYHGFFNDNLS